MDWSWEIFWAPLLVRGLVTAVIGAIVGYVIRGWLKEIVRKLDGTDVKLQRTSIDASLAAENASSSRQSSEDTAARLKKLEDAIEAWRKAEDDHLGQRALQEVRFRKLEERGKIDD